MQINNVQWTKFQDTINNFGINVNTEIVKWGRRPWMESEFGEDNDNTLVYTELKALVGFNVFRTWPITTHTPSGELDNQNMVVYLNIKYLETNEWLTSEGYFKFDPDLDEFIHRGIRYKCEGDTLASQSKDYPLFIMLVLVRSETRTGTNRDEQV